MAFWHYPWKGKKRKSTALCGRMLSCYSPWHGTKTGWVVENSWSFMPPPTATTWPGPVVVIPAAARGEGGPPLLVEAGVSGPSALSYWTSGSLGHARCPHRRGQLPGPMSHHQSPRPYPWLLLCHPCLDISSLLFEQGPVFSFCNSI